MNFFHKKSVFAVGIFCLISFFSFGDEEARLPKFQQFPDGFSGSLPAYELTRFGLNQDLVQKVVEWAVSEERKDEIYVFDNSEVIAFYEEIHNSKFSVNKVISDSYVLDCIAWCNALSEKEGLQPVYYVVPENEVFRDTGMKKKISIAAYTNQNGYRIASSAEVKNALKTERINAKYKNFLLARTLPEQSKKIKNPKVVVERKPSVPVRIMASTLNPVLGLGSYLEGDFKSGFSYTFWEGLGFSTAYVGWYITKHWQETLDARGMSEAKIDYLIPNIIVGTGLGIYGVSALTGLISPYVKPISKKYTFECPNPSVIEVTYGFEPLVAPNGDLGFGLSFAW